MNVTEQVPGYPGPPSVSQPMSPGEPAPGSGGPACRAAEGLAGLGDRELLAIAGSLPPGSARRDAARELLVSRYGHLVRACAHQYSRSPEPAEDLIQVGTSGCSRRSATSTRPSAAAWPPSPGPASAGRSRSTSGTSGGWSTSRAPLQELLLEIRADAGQLAQDLGRVPAEAELARHLGVTGEAVREARKAGLAFHTGSLDAPLPGEPGTATLADLLGAEDPRLEHTLGMQAVATPWGELPPREQKILIMRFYGDMSQAQLGQQLGISQMHVSRLSARALAYLRTRLLGQQDQPAPGPCCQARYLRAARHDGTVLPRHRETTMKASTGLSRWMSRGTCLDEDPEIFFPIDVQGPALDQASVAKAVCRRCAVTAACLSFGLETRQEGVWGGTTWEERLAMRRRPGRPR